MTPQPLKTKTLFNRKTRPAIISRKDASRLHFASRFIERYKATPTTDELLGFVKGIKNGRAHKMSYHEQGKNRYLVAWRGQLISVVFDWNLDQLITAYDLSEAEADQLTKNPGSALKKWLQETKQAAKEAASTPS